MHYEGSTSRDVCREATDAEHSLFEGDTENLDQISSRVLHCTRVDIFRHFWVETLLKSHLQGSLILDRGSSSPYSKLVRRVSSLMVQSFGNTEIGQPWKSSNSRKIFQSEKNLGIIESRAIKDFEGGLRLSRGRRHEVIFKDDEEETFLSLLFAGHVETG